MAVKLPVLPKAAHSLDLAKITNYLIEERLLRPLQDLYSINVVAEYYRFKRRMMESPFECKPFRNAALVLDIIFGCSSLQRCLLMSNFPINYLCSVSCKRIFVCIISTLCAKLACHKHSFNSQASFAIPYTSSC